MSEQKPSTATGPDYDALARQQARWRAIHALVVELEDLRARLAVLEKARKVEMVR